MPPHRQVFRGGWNYREPQARIVKISAVNGFLDRDKDFFSPYACPPEWNLKDGKTKYILRQAAAANVDPQYWMLPKVGLQDSFSFVMRSDAGRAWRAARREEVRESAEYGLLRSALPGGRVEADRLIGLVVWKAQQG